MEYLSIDRIEEGIAVCEDNGRRRVELALSQLPDGSKPGDILFFDGTSYQKDAGETERRKQRAAELQKKLFGRK
ncbi:hypothetical protein CLOSTMETH_02469 [[Clostridium] methylpentosum DSM 5476]|uniref:DUF3006 domain-containing protein n=1 Tax=[Clostridium] methylpentosum DSM 5476 TaxID=537013 RepID=C0EF30_9FIRM|nr:hypothetical protein CLOSTMETH_02469 [[Clostridium] methylpentosum DSM 5476]MDY3988547.1 DUF3006 domain-containing protein [Massilioclostridium sp.]MEE1491559.1 DUF3006 domain-containing protein [Massilioclostridium sp.]